MNMCKISKVLVLIGALNAGLDGIGAFLNRDLNVIELLTRSVPTVGSVVYVIIGLAAVVVIFGGKDCCKA